MGKKRSAVDWDEALAAFEAHLHTRGRSERTVAAYVSSLRSFGQFYRYELQKPGPYVARLHETDFHAFVDYLRIDRGLAVASVNCYIAALHSFARVALATQWARRDLALDLTTFRAAPPDEPDPLTASDERRLLTSVDLNGRNGRRDLAILHILLQAGLRVSELAALSVRDVTLNKTNGRVRVLSEKTHAERVVPLNLVARRALQAYLDRRGQPVASAPLFLSERRQRISVSSVQHLVKKYLTMAGRGDLSTHDLRHHFAARLYAKTRKLTVVQRALGHRSIVTTARYATTTAKELAEAVESFSDAPSGQD